MALTSRDIVSLSHARAHLSELADEVHRGAEKIITKNGEGFVALVDAQRLDYYHQLERERGQLQLLQDLERGLRDLEENRVSDAKVALKRMKARRIRR
jgi:prevent-host-death family protein